MPLKSVCVCLCVFVCVHRLWFSLYLLNGWSKRSGKKKVWSDAAKHAWACVCIVIVLCVGQIDIHFSKTNHNGRPSEMCCVRHRRVLSHSCYLSESILSFVFTSILRGMKRCQITFFRNNGFQSPPEKPLKSWHYLVLWNLFEQTHFPLGFKSSADRAPSWEWSFVRQQFALKSMTADWTELTVLTS